MRRGHRGSVTAAELLAELEQYPAYVEGRRRDREREDENRQRYREAARRPRRRRR